MVASSCPSARPEGLGFAAAARRVPPRISNKLEFRLLTLELLQLFFSLIALVGGIDDETFSGIILTILTLGVGLIIYSLAYGYMKERKEKKDEGGESEEEDEGTVAVEDTASAAFQFLRLARRKSRKGARLVCFFYVDELRHCTLPLR